MKISESPPTPREESTETSMENFSRKNLEIALNLWAPICLFLPSLEEKLALLFPDKDSGISPQNQYALSYG